MKEFLKKNIYLIIIIILIIMILILLPMAFNKRMVNKEVIKEEPEEVYEKLTENFLDAIGNGQKMAEFLTTGFDYQGVLAWQNVSGNIDSFADEYKSLEQNTTKKREFRDKMITLAYENEFDFSNIRLFSIEENKSQDDIHIYNAKIASSFPGEKTDIEDTIITFYKNKIINIELFDDDDNSLNELFDEYKTKSHVKMMGYYIDKSQEEIWDMYSFRQDKTVIYEIILCPKAIEQGLGCGMSSGDKKGKYEIIDNKIKITFDETIGEEGWEKLEKKIELELTLENDNVIKDNKITYNWQEDYAKN